MLLPVFIAARVQYPINQLDGLIAPAPALRRDRDMKHFIFILAITLLGSVAAIAVPFWGVMLYYTFATLRPQYIWGWSLTSAPTIRWSLTAGLIAMIATLVNLPTVIRTFRPNRVIVMVLAYVSLMLLSLLTAFDTNRAMFWAVEYGKVFMMAVIATLVIQRFWQVRAVAVMIVISLGYIAYQINFLYFVEGRLDVYHNGYGGLDNNGAGMMLIIGLPFAYFLAMSPMGGWGTMRRIFGCVVGLIIMHAVMMTFSRGAMLAGVVGLVWLMIHHRPRIQSAALSALLLVAITVMAGDQIRDRFTSISDYSEDASANARFNSWDAAISIALDHPLLGTGIRNSNLFSQNYGSDLAGRTIHNQYLQIAADSGIPAMIVYVLIVAFALLGLGAARKRCFKAIDDIEEGPEPEGPHSRQDLLDRARDAGLLCISLQTSVLMFAFSALFLSVELVELPWLLIVLAGILPGAVDRRLRGLGGFEEEEEDDRFSPEPPRQLQKPHTPNPYRHAA